MGKGGRRLETETSSLLIRKSFKNPEVRTMRANNRCGRMRQDISPLLIKKDVIIRGAMKKMDDGAERILFVVDDDMKMLGSLTDGDIRRWILSEGALYESVDKLFNPNPIFVDEDYDMDNVKNLMIEQKIDWIPVLDKEHRIADIIIWEDIFKRKQRDKDILHAPVVIMAGGKGLRLDPFTKILPKPLIPIGDKPVSELTMDNFYEYGCCDFYLVLGYKAEMVKSYFDNTEIKYRIHYIKEDKPLGTAGGLNLLPEDFAKNFFITNCDTIIKADYADIYNFHMDNGNDITLVSSMQHFKVPYGVIEIDNRGSLKQIIEKPEYDFLTNTGMYVAKKGIIDFVPKGEMFHLTDLLEVLKKNGKKVGVYPISQKSWLDVGRWEEYRRTLKEFGSGADE